MTQRDNTYRNKYALYGAAFGFSFPIVASLVDAMVTGHSIIEVQKNPLLWIIWTAPPVLAFFSSIAGKNQDKLAAAMHAVEQANEELEGANKKLNDVNAELEGLNSQLESSNEDLQGANDELIRASQLKSQFLANMSHELRTPLNAIIGFSRILIKKTSDSLPPRQAKNLKMVHESGQHLLELVNDILDIERIEAGMLSIKKQDVDVIEMTEDVVAKLIPAANDKGLSLSAKAPSGSLHLDSDPVRMRQLLDNLVNNAIKYSDEGEIELELSIKPEGKDEVHFIIRDQGIGIKAEQLPYIFDAFRQVDGSTTRAQGGVGLGLHLVKKIAQLLGGDITVTSELGKGSVFTLSFPGSMIRSGDAEEKVVPTMDLGPQGEGPVLLIIDDTPSMIEIMRTELVDAGFRVHASLSGKEGLDKARSLRPDAILLDIIMPEMDGWQVLKELRRDPALCSTPVIVTSQLDESPRAYDLGIVAWMTKPMSPEEFNAVFARIGVKSQDDVLVVEDDPATSSMIVQHLTEMDIAARTALDGQQAVESLTDRLPKAVILDIMLPKLDGFGVLKELRKMENGGKVPVIVYTAKDLSDEEKLQLSTGIIDVVGKGEKAGLESVVDQVKAVLSVKQLSEISNAVKN